MTAALRSLACMLVGCAAAATFALAGLAVMAAERLLPVSQP